MDVQLPGSDVIIPMYRNMHEQPLDMHTLTKNPWSQGENFFSVQTISLHESLEGLNSFLAYSDSELWPYP